MQYKYIPIFEYDSEITPSSLISVLPKITEACLDLSNPFLDEFYGQAKLLKQRGEGITFPSIFSFTDMLLKYSIINKEEAEDFNKYIKIGCKRTPLSDFYNSKVND